MSALWVIGDVHGELGGLRTLLLRAGLGDVHGHWTGGTARLVLLGDLTDRGAFGAGVVRQVMALEQQAALAGGVVVSLLGNHEVMLLAAAHWGEGDEHGFYAYWQSNGGRAEDLYLLAPTELAWLAARPALARLDDWLFVHADSDIYLHYGHSPEAVQAALMGTVQGRDPVAWSGLMDRFVERFGYLGPGGRSLARQMTERFGGSWLAHGHTPTFALRGHPPGPEGPHRYAGHLVLALDSGLGSVPGAGFAVQLGGTGILRTVTLSTGGGAT